MRSWGVAAAATGLIIAVWLALTLAPSADQRVSNRGANGSRFAVPVSLDGFLADSWFLPDDPMLGFVEIPAGPFTMGSDPGADPLAFDVEWWGDGRVQGIVDLPTFYLGRFEVTVAQYTRFLNDSDHPLADAQSLEAPPNHPVTWVAWTDALAYARWLDGALRSAADANTLPPRLASLIEQGWRVSLPGEAQWEKAARGSDARIYPWGAEPRRDRANYGAQGTTPVGSFECPECPFELADMSGNVWEWTRSPYQPYPYSDADDLESVGQEALWVMRGGSFGDPEQYMRAANRGGADPGARRPFIGFRVALVRD